MKKSKRLLALTAAVCLLGSLAGFSANAYRQQENGNISYANVSGYCDFGHNSGYATTTCTNSMAFLQADATYTYRFGRVNHESYNTASTSGYSISASAQAEYVPAENIHVLGWHYVELNNATWRVYTEKSA